MKTSRTITMCRAAKQLTASFALMGALFLFPATTMAGTYGTGSYDNGSYVSSCTSNCSGSTIPGGSTPISTSGTGTGSAGSTSSGGLADTGQAIGLASLTALVLGGLSIVVSRKAGQHRLKSLPTTE